MPRAPRARLRDEIPGEGGEGHARAAERARRQWGNLTRRQLEAAGLSSRQIDGMAAGGLLHRRHHGVYAFGHVSPAPEAAWAAALLAAGPGAALSHTAAAALHGLLAPRSVAEVTAPTQRRGDDRLRVHRGELPEKEVTRVRGLRVTCVARTLLDLGAAGRPIDRLVHRAAASGLIGLDALREYADASGGRRGVRALRAALARPHTRSAGERRLHRFCVRRGLPVPEMNALVGRIRVDALWRELRLAVELDHDQTHGTAWALEDDAWRDRYVRARGIRLLRIEDGDLTVLAEELRRLTSGGRPAAGIARDEVPRRGGERHTG